VAEPLELTYNWPFRLVVVTGAALACIMLLGVDRYDWLANCRGLRLNSLGAGRNEHLSAVPGVPARRRIGADSSPLQGVLPKRWSNCGRVD
jgi:hypothetical protein